MNIGRAARDARTSTMSGMWSVYAGVRRGRPGRSPTLGRGRGRPPMRVETPALPGLLRSGIAARCCQQLFVREHRVVLVQHRCPSADVGGRARCESGAGNDSVRAGRRLGPGDGPFVFEDGDLPASSKSSTGTIDRRPSGTSAAMKASDGIGVLHAGGNPPSRFPHRREFSLPVAKARSKSRRR